MCLSLQGYSPLELAVDVGSLKMGMYLNVEVFKHTKREGKPEPLKILQPSKSGQYVPVTSSTDVGIKTCCVLFRFWSHRGI